MASNTGKLLWAAWKYRKHRDMEQTGNGQINGMGYVKIQEKSIILKTVFFALTLYMNPLVVWIMTRRGKLTSELKT